MKQPIKIIKDMVDKYPNVIFAGIKTVSCKVIL